MLLLLRNRQHNSTEGCLVPAYIVSDTTEFTLESGTSEEREDNDASADEDSISDILGTSLSIGQHAFSQMEADVDKQRRARRQDEQLTMSAEQHQLQ